MSLPGQHPLGESGLHPERTALAWRRLALVLLGLAIASTRLLWPRLDAWALVPTLAIAVVAALLLAGSHRRYLAQVRTVTTTAPDGRLPLFAAIAATVIAVLWLVVVATGR